MSAEKYAAFTFVLHSHIPYCRRAGRWPHGEEWLHEAAAETYVPLLNALYDLRDEGVPFKLTVGLTPVLTEQLADPDVVEHFEIYLEDRIQRAIMDGQRFRAQDEAHMAFLAGWYQNWYQQALTTFRERFGRNAVAGFRDLQDSGHVEIVTSAATHGYLPLLSRDSSVFGQLASGARSYERHFGRAPRAIWLPECAYRPSYYTSESEGGYIKPGLESFLAELKLGCFFAETHTVEGGLPVGKARDAVIGPYGNVPKRYVVPLPDYVEPTHKTTFRPYYVGGAEVAVIGRNNRTGMQVWSADWGYPGDQDYREFHKKDGVSGLQYWRVTGPRIDLGLKDAYHPDWAEYKVAEHARHFAWLVQDIAEQSYREEGGPGLISANYDTELFGHWWFEGIAWIKQVLQHLSKSKRVEMMTSSEFLEAHPPEDVLMLPESSWGTGGGHFTWDNGDTGWMWEPIRQAEKRMEELVARYPQAEDALADVLNQAARELLLLQSSDWPFLVTTGQARDYAVERFTSHVDRFNELADLAEADATGAAGKAVADRYFALDNIFPDIDYRLFADREQRR